MDSEVNIKMGYFLLLPVEIKFKIFTYLDGASKLNMLEVCSEFRDIGLDRRIMRCLDLACGYQLSTLKALQQRPLYSIVTSLNVNDVYWVSAYAWLKTLKHFVHLRELFALNIKLSYAVLVDLLNNFLQKVTKLAYYLDSTDSSSEIIFERLKNPLSHLYIAFGTQSVCEMYLFLKQFTDLEELWLVGDMQQFGNDYENDFNQLPKVSNKIVLYRKTSNFYLHALLLDVLQKTDVVGYQWYQTYVESADDFTLIVYENLVNTTIVTDLSNIFTSALEKSVLYIRNVILMENYCSVKNYQEMLLGGEDSVTNVQLDSLNLVRNMSLVRFHGSQANPGIFETFLLSPNTAGLRTVRTESLPFWRKHF